MYNKKIMFINDDYVYIFVMLFYFVYINQFNKFFDVDYVVVYFI